METIALKTIEFAGYLSEREVGQGKTAIWNGTGIEEVTQIDLNDYSFQDEEIEEQLAKAQSFVDRRVQENDWIITPKAFVNVYEFYEEL